MRETNSKLFRVHFARLRIRLRRKSRNPVLGYPRLRKAKIPLEARDIFERLGEAGIQLTIASGLTPRSEGLREIYAKPETLQHAEQWLTERADLHARYEWRLEKT